MKTHKHQSTRRRPDIRTRFKRGNVPWNKGMAGWCPAGSKVAWFKPGGIRGKAARLYCKVGSVRVRIGKLRPRARKWRFSSARWIKVRDDGPPKGRWVPLARWLWERQHGPVPAGCFVVHADGDLMNDDLANLILVDRRGHMARLYQRPAVIAKARKWSAIATRRRHRDERLLRAARREQLMVRACA